MFSTIIYVLNIVLCYFFKDSLDANPALFCKKQPAVLDVVDQYLELCEFYDTPIANVKQHLINFCGY